MTDQPQTPTTDSKAIVPITDKAPLVYGDRQEVKSLAARIMAIHPSAKKIGERGALLLAQLGIALGLNPLPGTGHIHAWIDSDGVLCVHIGLEGRAALARRESLYSVSARPMRPEEVNENGLKPGDRGAIAELYRFDVTREAAALKIPVVPFIGIGIASTSERVPKGRSLAWRASQRAIKDALRAAYSFSLPGELAGAVRLSEDESSLPAEVIDGEIDEGEPESSGLAEATSQPTRPYAPEALRSWLADLAQSYGDRQVNPKQRGLFVGQLSECFAPDPDHEDKRHAAIRWLFGVESSKDMSGAQVIAALEWLKPSKDSGGAYLPDPVAAQEARAVLAEASGTGEAEPVGLFEQGQTAANGGA